MKFTEEKLEKAFTELLGQEGFPHYLGITIIRKLEEVFKIENVASLVALSSQLRCEDKAVQSIFKMSSFFANKLDKSIIFAAQ